MANVISCKTFKIKPENQVSAEGKVVNCKYAGASKVGIGPFAKTTHIYKAFVEVAGLEKPIVIKVKEAQGWNVGVVDGVKSIAKAFSKETPVNVGDVLKITYDKTKPKKCNVSE